MQHSEKQYSSENKDAEAWKILRQLIINPQPNFFLKQQNGQSLAIQCYMIALISYS